MECVIKFDLNNPESRMDHLRCTKSLDMALVLWEIQYNLKRKFEYQEMSSESWEKVEEVFEEINGLLESHDIRVDRLIE
jgi:hypothetical protein